MPMAAVAFAPMWPTMAASMYSIAVTTSCSRMEGMLSASAMRAVSDSGMSSPCRIRAESCSKEVSCSLLFSVLISCLTIIGTGRKIVKPGD